jgi:type II secretory pathway component PulL
MSRKVVALDIRENAISAISITSGFKSTSIDAHGYALLDDSAEGIRNAMEAIVEEINMDGSICVASVPASQTSFRNIVVPFNNPKKIRQILPFELESTLAVSTENLSIDFIPVKLSENSNNTDIIVACVENSQIEMYLKTLSDFSINPEIVTVGGYPTAFLLSQLDDFPDNGLVLDVGKNNSTLFLIIAKQIALIRSIPLSFSGSSILPDSSESSGLVEVERLCKGIQQTLFSVDEIFNLDFQPDAMLITGNGLDDKPLESHLSQVLGIPVKRSDLVTASGLSIKNGSKKSWNPSEMDNALALAQMELIGIDAFNFCKASFAEKNFWSEYGRRVIQTAALAGLVLMLAFFNVLFESYTLQKKVVQLDQQIADVFKQTFPDIKRIVDPLHQMRVKMKEMESSALFPTDFDNKLRTIDLLNRISRLIPETTDVELTRIVIGPENFVLSGNTDNFNTVDDIKSRLDTAGVFKKVTISSANIDRSNNRVRFKVKVDV